MTPVRLNNFDINEESRELLLAAVVFFITLKPNTSMKQVYTKTEIAKPFSLRGRGTLKNPDPRSPRRGRGKSIFEGDWSERK